MMKSILWVIVGLLLVIVAVLLAVSGIGDIRKIVRKHKK